MCFPYRYEDRIQVRVTASQEEVWKLVGSLSRVPEWDPHTVSAERQAANAWSLRFKHWEPMTYCIKSHMPFSFIRFASHNAYRNVFTDESFNIIPPKPDDTKAPTVVVYTFALRVYGWRSLFAWRAVPQLKEEMEALGQRLLQQLGPAPLQL